MPTVLGQDAWADIRESYGRGRSARSLGLEWGISTSAIYRRAVSERWAKQRRSALVAPDVAAFSPAHRREPDDPDVEVLPDLIGDVLTGEIHEPGFLARMAIGASGDALRNFEFDDAHKLIRLANEYARVAERVGQANLHTVLRAMTDPEFADHLFDVEDGEYNMVKDLYWTRRGKEEAARAKAAESSSPASGGSPGEAGSGDGGEEAADVSAR